MKRVCVSSSNKIKSYFKIKSTFPFHFNSFSRPHHFLPRFSFTNIFLQCSEFLHSPLFLSLSKYSLTLLKIQSFQIIMTSIQSSNTILTSFSNLIHRVNNNNNNKRPLTWTDRIKDGVESKGNSRNRVQINRLGNGSCIVPSYLDTKTRGGISLERIRWGCRGC